MKNKNKQNIGKGLIVTGVTLATILCGGKDAKASTTSFNKLNSNSVVVENIMKDIKYKKIDSYQNLIERTDTLSENQKLALLGATGDILGKFTYTPSKDKVASQNIFFDNLQDSLRTSNQNPLGECNHIHSHLEILANDISIKAAAVTGAINKKENHMYNLIKLKNRSAIVDYGNVFVSDTQNIDKTLEAYQKYRGVTVFKHLFYKDTEFKYKLITKDGRHFLDFIEYNETSEPMKDLLIYDVKDNDSKIILNSGNYANSIEFNNFGIFGKAGNIHGDSSSPMKNMKLVQGGFKKNFSISDFANISGNISFVEGIIQQDNDTIIPIKGTVYDGFVGLNNKTFKTIFRASRNRLKTDERVLFYDSTIGAGASYKILNNIEPYVITQYSSFPSDSGTEKSKMRHNELRFGMLFNIPKVNLSIEPYLTKRIWEKEFGTNMNFKHKNFEINAGGYATKSDYEMCPNKTGFNMGISKNFKNWKIWSKYKTENSDYDGEIEKQRTFNIGASVKF